MIPLSILLLRMSIRIFLAWFFFLAHIEKLVSTRLRIKSESCATRISISNVVDIFAKWGLNKYLIPLSILLFLFRTAISIRIFFGLIFLFGVKVSTRLRIKMKVTQQSYTIFQFQILSIFLQCVSSNKYSMEIFVLRIYLRKIIKRKDQ